MTVQQEGSDQRPGGARARGFDGWWDALLFALALSALNISYSFGNQMGVKPIAMLVWAMPSAAVMLLAVGGLGRDWAQIMAHPLSLVVGGGIIAMEAVYYSLIEYVTPTDGSLLVRLGVPAALLLGFLLHGRRPSRLSALGGIIIVATIAWYVPLMESTRPYTGLALATACAAIMSARSFATEYHPWNRDARTVAQKMRVTGLVLLVASLVGLLMVFCAMVIVSRGLLSPSVWLPSPAELIDPDTVILGLVVGALVLTAMQYLGFATVVKIGTESFIATTALIPVVTLIVQQGAVAAGLLRPIPVDWRIFPAMACVMAGVACVIAGQRRR